MPHVQASIVGNMLKAGLVRQRQQPKQQQGDAAAGGGEEEEKEKEEEWVYIEFGAGRGYLTSFLAAATRARRLLMVDVRGFRFKADRQVVVEEDTCAGSY